MLPSRRCRRCHGISLTMANRRPQSLASGLVVQKHPFPLHSTRRRSTASRFGAVVAEWDAPVEVKRNRPDAGDERVKTALAAFATLLSSSDRRLCQIIVCANCARGLYNAPSPTKWQNENRLPTSDESKEQRRGDFCAAGNHAAILSIAHVFAYGETRSLVVLPVAIRRLDTSHTSVRNAGNSGPRRSSLRPKHYSRAGCRASRGPKGECPRRTFLARRRVACGNNAKRCRGMAGLTIG